MDIRAIIELTGLSARAFAIRYHIPYRTVQNWLGGVNKCPEYVLELLQFRVKHDKDLNLS